MSRHGSRPVSAKAIAAFAVLEHIGKSSAKTLATEVAQNQQTVESWLGTALISKIVTADKTYFPRRWCVTPDWRQRVEAITPAVRQSAACAARDPDDLQIEYAGCPPPGALQKITGPLAPTVWRGLSHLVPA